MWCFSHIICYLNFIITDKITFLIEESTEGGYIAKGLGVSIFTQADSIEILKELVVDAVDCHFDEAERGIEFLHFKEK